MFIHINEASFQVTTFKLASSQLNLPYYTVPHPRRW